MNAHVHALSEKIQALNDEQIAEVEDCVEFLRLCGQERQLSHASAAASAAVFAAVWNNPEDDVYDARSISLKAID